MLDNKPIPTEDRMLAVPEGADADKICGTTADQIVIDEPEEDPVNSPGHYNSGSVEAIAAIQASMSVEAFEGYCKGNTLKYIWRYSYKGKPLQDLDKALWYLQRLRDVVAAEAEEDERERELASRCHRKGDRVEVDIPGYPFKFDPHAHGPVDIPDQPKPPCELCNGLGELDVCHCGETLELHTPFDGHSFTPILCPKCSG